MRMPRTVAEHGTLMNRIGYIWASGNTEICQHGNDPLKTFYDQDIYLEENSESKKDQKNLYKMH
jgi:hypothetical protein